ncbi:MAG: MarR family winged helix-turn-helix transcriptional regulator [Lentimicrobiaceae bacterium]|nr:MarR family winged helix-turn-helix transcriptional regulator [Lentimicrobiaceae bacterium]
MPDIQAEFFEHFPYGKRLSLVARRYYCTLIHNLDHLPVHKHFAILLAIEYLSKNCTQQALCDLLSVDKASMVRIMDYFKEIKMIAKTTNPDDRRASFITLTPEARTILPEVHRVVDELNRKATSGLTPEQITAFFQTLELIKHNLGSNSGI